MTLVDHPEGTKTIKDLAPLHPVVDNDNDSGVVDNFYHQAVNPTLDDFLLDEDPSNHLQPTSVNIEGSTDVVIGPVTHYNGPVTIYQHPQNGVASAKNNGKLVKSDSMDVPNVNKTTVAGRPTVSRYVKVTAALLAVLVVASAVTWVAVTKSTNPIVTHDSIPPTYDVPANADSDTPTIAQLRPGNFVSRHKWGAASPHVTKPLQHPTHYVIVAHTATPLCGDFNGCCKRLQAIQAYVVNSGKGSDVTCNFYIGGSDSLIFEGRGWDVVNQYRNNTVAVCFVGNYVFDRLDDALIGAFDKLMEWGVREGKLDGKYGVVCHNQVDRTESPGRNVIEVVKKWPHYVSGDFFAASSI